MLTVINLISIAICTILVLLSLGCCLGYTMRDRELRKVIRYDKERRTVIVKSNVEVEGYVASVPAKHKEEE